MWYASWLPRPTPQQKPWACFWRGHGQAGTRWSLCPKWPCLDFSPEEERFCLLHLSALLHWACIQFSGKAYGVRKEKKESKDEWRFCLLYVAVDSLQKWLNWRYECLQCPLRESCPPAGKWRVFFVCVFFLLRNSARDLTHTFPVTSTSKIVQFTSQKMFSRLASRA